MVTNFFSICLAYFLMFKYVYTIYIFEALTMMYFSITVKVGIYAVFENMKFFFDIDYFKLKK